MKRFINLPVTKTGKNVFLIIGMWLVSITITACDNNDPDDNQSGTEQPEAPTTGNGRYLVVYCSRSGNTEQVAETIRTTLNCDILKVEPAIPYDSDYNAMLARSQAEQAAIAAGNYPPITTVIENPDKYDMIFIGYPIWYSHIATPMQTFLHNHAEMLKNKQIALFATSGSSGISTSVSDARALCPDATFTETLLITSGNINQTSTRVTTWLKQLKVIQ